MKILLTLLIAMGFASHAWAQGGAEPSGLYEALKLGVDSTRGIVTGFYQDGPGDWDDDNLPESTCVLFISGKKDGDKYTVQTFIPKEMNPGSPGELSFVAPKNAGGKPAVRLKLTKVSAGCWDANASLGKPEGAHFNLTKTGNWSAVRIVQAKNAYFYESPEAPAPKKTNLKRGAVIVVTDSKPGWVFADNMIRDKGWLKEGDLFPLQP